MRNSSLALQINGVPTTDLERTEKLFKEIGVKYTRKEFGAAGIIDPRVLDDTGCSGAFEFKSDGKFMCTSSNY